MAQPGILSSQIPPGEDHVMRALADIRRELRELGPSIMHSFQSVVDELAAHQATLDAQQATLTANVADIAANVASINDLLTQVVKPQNVYFYAQGFAVPTTGTVFASSTVTVPAGFTSAVITVVSRLAAVNSTAAADYLSCVSKVNGIGGASLQVPINPSFTDFNVHALSTVLTGLTGGGTILLEVRGNTANAAWAANAFNSAFMSGMILWFR